MVGPMQTDNHGTSLSRDAFAYVPVKLIPAITGLLSIVILTRNLAPEEYGRYSVVITIALLLVQLAGTWLSNSVLYVYPEYSGTKDESEFRRQTINLQLLVAIPATGIAYLAIYILTHMQLLALVGGILVLGQVMQALMMTFLQSARKIYTQAIAVGGQSISQLAILCVLIFVANGKETAAIVAVVLGLLSGNIVLIIANRKSRILALNESTIISRELIVKLLSYGLPMCLWFFATQFYTIGDRIFLQFFGANEELGQYASFRDLATGCAGFLTMPLLMASHPIIMAKWNGGCAPDEIERIISGNVAFLATLFIPLILMTDVIGHDLVIALFGQRYALAENIMVLTVISIFIGSITMHIQKGLEVSGRTLLMAKLSLLTAICGAFAFIIAIPSFGVFGCALVVVLSHTLYVGMVLFTLRKTPMLRIPPSFWLKLMVWFVVVECALRLFTAVSRGHLADSTIFLANVFGIGVATLLLYLADHRIRLLIAKCVSELRKASN